MKNLQHLIEAAALYLLFTAFKLLPLDVASYIGGFMARSIGPYLGAHKTARKNLSMIYPDMDSDAQYRLLMKMWDNLGRVAGELPHLPGTGLYERMRVSGIENLPAPNRPVMFFSAHLGNWELTYPIAFQHGIPLTNVYRQANNPYVESIVTGLRSSQSLGMIPKGPKGAVKLVRSIKAGHSIAMLIDQKMNDGIAVPFFGRPAMTAPAIAELVLRYDMPLIPVRIIRTKGAHFEGKIYPPMSYEKTGDQERDVLAIMTQINRMVESWIREYPEQWFWVHQRWPKETY